MPDVPIVNRAMVPAPKDYTLPQSQEILLKTVRAAIDGTGAGGSWLPTLQLISNNGDVMWTAIDTSTVQAAGGTVDVSWFPGLGGSSNVTLSNPGLMAARVNATAKQTIPEGTNTAVTWGAAVIDSGSPTPFWSAGHPTRLTAPVAGAYLSLASLEWDILPTANAPGYTSSYLYKNGAAAYLYDANQAEALVNVAYSITGNHHGIFELAAGDYLELFAYNNNNASANRDLIYLPPTENHYSSWCLILVSVG